MSRTLPESHELQRLADEMEMRRIEARLKDWNRKPTREERIIGMVADGWSFAAADDDTKTLGWGIPGAYRECGSDLGIISAREDATGIGPDKEKMRYGHLPDTGGKPSHLRARPPRA